MGCSGENIPIEINASIGELSECSLLLELRGLFGILQDETRQQSLHQPAEIGRGIRSLRQP